MQFQFNNNNTLFQYQNVQNFDMTQAALLQPQQSQTYLIHNKPQQFPNNQNQINMMQQNHNNNPNLLKQQYCFSNQLAQLQVKQEENLKQNSWYVQKVDQKVQDQILNLYQESNLQQNQQQNDLKTEIKQFVKCNNYIQENSSDYSGMKCSLQQSYTKTSIASSQSTNNTVKPVTKLIQKKKIAKSYQDTKNIPKNFGKAIMKYIKEKREDAQKLLGNKYSFAQFYQRVIQKKDKITSIKEFKTLFEEEISEKEQSRFPQLSEEALLLFNKVYRILAYKFLKTEFESYILANKKIKHGKVMNKYKVVLLKNMVNPKQFNSWKFQE